MKKMMLLFLMGINVSNSFGSDMATEKRLANTCIACHGANGISNSPLWPNLAGQKKIYLLKQLKDFRSGERRDPLMSPMASTLSDQDMESLAGYFSTLKQ